MISFVTMAWPDFETIFIQIKEEIIRLGEQLITILHVLLRALLRFAARLALKFRANRFSLIFIPSSSFERLISSKCQAVLFGFIL
mmetsp:Transcript_8128/g.10721  ORF Transcript_8128/g.10721 Transcript_8128/m.10721 type:complete len:85 (+) Transcript_8128:261-515(+)